MMNGFNKPHVVAVPFPALGHSIPFLDMAKLLASGGLTVSYITTPANVSRLQPLLDNETSSDIRLVVLPSPVVEGLPEGRESVDVLPTELVDRIFVFAEKLAEPFDAWFEGQLLSEGGGLGRPICIISDIFIGWSVDSALKFGIRSVVFNTCGAFGTSLLFSCLDQISQNKLQKDGDSVVLSDLPSPLRLHKNQICRCFFDPDFSDPVEVIFRRHLRRLNRGWGMLLNTFEELEPLYVRHLQENVMGGRNVWCIGPVFPSISVTQRGKSSDISQEELTEWLDCRDPRSVVYVSFGSQTFLSEHQTHALARGLQSSDRPFIWVIKAPPKLGHCDGSFVNLPNGFADMTEGRGLIIKGWAPQLLILSHPSVGAFVTHCGWNSTLEGICHGVPLIAWPMIADQHFNSNQVSDCLGVGVQFCQHADGIPSDESLKEAVRLVLGDPGGQEMRKRAENLKNVARKAVGHGGSSRSNLEAFVEEMRKLNVSTNNAKMNHKLLITAANGNR